MHVLLGAAGSGAGYLFSACLNKLHARGGARTFYMGGVEDFGRVAMRTADGKVITN